MEVNYNEEFLQSVAGIDQNLDQLAIGVVTQETTAFTYDIKYLKSVNQYWSEAKKKAKLQEEISHEEKILEKLALQDKKNNR